MSDRSCLLAGAVRRGRPRLHCGASKTRSAQWSHAKRPSNRTRSARTLRRACKKKSSGKSARSNDSSRFLSILVVLPKTPIR